MTTDTVAKAATARATAGRSAAWPRAPACSPRPSRRCSSSSPPTPSSTPPSSTACCAPRRRDLRPGRLRRLHVDQRHRRAPRLRRLGRRGRRRRPARRRHRRLRRAWPASSSPTPRAPTTTSPSRSSTPRASTTPSRSPGPSPATTSSSARVFGNDPNWGRVLAAVGTTRGRLRPHDPRRLDERRAGLPRRRRGGGPLPRRPQRAARCTSSSTSTPATPTATVWTNDLTHDYVHENSAYST